MPKRPTEQKPPKGPTHPPYERPPEKGPQPTKPAPERDPNK